MHQYKRQLRSIDGVWSALRALLVRAPLTLLNAVVQAFMPADSRSWLFVNQNREFTGNLYYFFEFVRRERPDVRARLMLYDKQLALELEARYGADAAAYAWSWRAFRWFFASRVIVIAYGMVANAFFPYVLRRRAKLVLNLWHGVPLKRVGYQARHSFERQRRWERQHYTKMVASSKFEQLAYACCFGMNIDDVWITGVPRNDRLFLPAQALAAPVPGGTRVVLYAPTWRDGADNAKLFPFDGADLHVLDAWLEQRSAVLLVRHHYIERATPFEGTKNIIHDDGSRFGEVQQILASTSVLITDYSSIYLDFLLLDRPVIFIPYDAAEYEKRRGFMLPYEWATPGEKVRAWPEFLHALDRSLAAPDEGAQRREEVRRFTHEFFDGRASERVCARVLEEVGLNV